jgi:hypothetical protein
VSFGTYTTGFLILIAGLIYGASLMHVPTFWLVVGWIMLAGQALLILGAATRKEGLDLEDRFKRVTHPRFPQRGRYQ